MVDVNETIAKEFDGKSRKEVAEIYLNKADDREKFKTFFSSYDVLTGPGGLNLNIESNLTKDLRKDWEEFLRIKIERKNSSEDHNVSEQFKNIENAAGDHAVIQKMKEMVEGKSLIELPIDKLAELINSGEVQDIIKNNADERAFFDSTILTAYRDAKALQEKGDKMEGLAGRVFDSLKDKLEEKAKQVSIDSNEEEHEAEKTGEDLERDRDTKEPDETHIDEEVGQAEAIEFFKHPNARFDKFSENLEGYLSMLRLNPEEKKDGKPIIDDPEVLRKWSLLKEMNSERAAGVMTVRDDDGNPKKDASGLMELRESIYTSDRLQKSDFDTLETLHGSAEKAKDTFMTLAKDLYHVKSMADLKPNQVDLLLANPEITDLTKGDTDEARINKSYFDSIKNVSDKAERTNKHKAKMDALKAEVWKTFEPLLEERATAILNKAGIPIPEPEVEKPEETVSDDKDKEEKGGEEEKKEGEKPAEEKKDDEKGKKDQYGRITNKDLMEGFSLSDDVVQGLLDRNKDGSLLTMVTQFAGSRTPEEAVQNLLVNMLLYLPRKVLFALDFSETFLKERNKYLEEQREKRKDEVAGLKGLGAADRVKGIEDYLIRAKVHKDENGNYQGLPELARLLNEQDPDKMKKLGITFDDKGNVVGGLNRKQEDALIDAALMQGYHETYNGLDPSVDEFEKLRLAADKNIKNGDYLRMAAADALDHATDDTKTPGTPDADKKGLLDDEEFLKMHEPLIKAFGDVSKLAGALKEENPKLLEGLGLKFDDKGLVDGKITEEQKAELLNRIFHSQYLKNHKDGLPSTEEIEDAISTAQTFISTGMYERLAKELEARMGKDKKPDEPKKEEKPIDFSKFEDTEINSDALKHKIGDIHIDAKPAEKPIETIFVAAPTIDTGTLEDAKARTPEERMKREAEEKHEVKNSTGETVEISNAELNKNKEEVKVDGDVNASKEPDMKFVPAEKTDEVMSVKAPERTPDVPPPPLPGLKINKDAMDKMSPNTIISPDKTKSEDAPIKLKNEQPEITVGDKKMTLKNAHATSILSTTPNALIKEVKEFSAETEAVKTKAKETEKSRAVLNKYVYLQNDEIVYISPDKTINKTPEAGRSTGSEGR